MLEIVNKSNGVVIADKAVLRKDVFFKTKGLMFSKPLKNGQALILEATEESISGSTIHMLFVFFKIDVIWLDQEKKVVDIKYGVRAFTPSISPREPAKYIIEVKKNTAKNIQIGDEIEFREQ